MDTRASLKVAGALLFLSLLQPFAVWRPLVIGLGLSVPQDRFMGTMRDVISSMCALTVGGPFMNPVYAVRAARLARRFANGIGAVLLCDGIRSSSLRLTRVALQVTQANPFHMCLAILRSLELSPQSALHVSGEIARRQPEPLLSLCVDNRISFLDAVRSEHVSNRLLALLLVTRQFSQTFSVDENLLVVHGLREFMQCEVNLAEMIDFGASVNGMPDNNVPSGDAVVDRRPKRNGKMRDDELDGGMQIAPCDAKPAELVGFDASVNAIPASKRPHDDDVVDQQPKRVRHHKGEGTSGESSEKVLTVACIVECITVARRAQ